MKNFSGLILGLVLFVVMIAAVGCRFLGGYGNDSEVASLEAGTGGNVVLPGKVALTNDVDSGLLVGIRSVVASGTTLGQQVSFSGLKAQLYSYSQVAISPLTAPIDVSASGTFSFTISSSWKNLFVRVFNASESLVLLSVVNSPSTSMAVVVSERTTALGGVVLAAAESGKFLLGTEVESQISPTALSEIENLIQAGLKDPIDGMKSFERSQLLITAAGTISGSSTGTITGVGTTTTLGSLWPKTVLGATALNSPMLSALVSQFGQTSRDALNALSQADLDNAVKGAYAVGVDLSALNPETAGADPVIRAALRLGTPIVFENNAALTKFLSGLTGQAGLAGLSQWTGLTSDESAKAASAMAAAIGAGIESQIAVLVPSFALTPTGISQIFCIGAGSEKPFLSTGSLSLGSGTTQMPTISKTLADSKAAQAFTEPSALINMVSSAISQGIRLRSSPRSRISMDAGTMPSGITKKEYLVRFPEFVWYPRNRSQDFVIHLTVRAQLFVGNGGEKKWLRFIMDDSGDTAGFFNRGALYFKERDDKGYFIGGASVRISTNDSWVNFSGRDPGYVDAGEHRQPTSYSPPEAKSETSFEVDYVENGVKKTWTSRETRQFEMHEFECQTWPGAEWRWRLMLTQGILAGENSSKTETRRLDTDDKTAFSPDRRGEYLWERMCNTSGMGNASSNTVDWMRKVSRGTDGAALHPRVQSYYWVPSNEKRTACFSLEMNQEVWNVWSEFGPRDYRNVYSAGTNKSIWVNFEKASVQSVLWASNTQGNDGAVKRMQNDGNLVILRRRALWSTNTAGNPGAYKTFLDDGNLIIYSREKRILWRTHTGTNPGSTLKMQEDGNLVIYNKYGKPLWASNTAGNPGAWDVMGSDGNYVIYVTDQPIWASNTAGNPGATLKMQDDGNLVVYSKDGRALWASNTAGNPGAYDVMGSDGNYVIYSAK